MTPGIVPDLSQADYLAAQPFVSSSELKRHLPEHYKPFSGSPSADIGSVLHARFTGDDTALTVVDAATWQGKAARGTREAVTASGGYAVLAGDLPTIGGMEGALRAHRVARTLLVDEPGRWELSVFADVEGVPSKCRFDRLLDNGVAVDVKTTKAGPGEYEISRAVLSLGYDLQEAQYRAVAEAAGIELAGFKFVFCQNIEPFHVTVVDLDESFLERGRALRDLALSRYCHPQMVDQYPGESEPMTLTLPRWATL